MAADELAAGKGLAGGNCRRRSEVWYTPEISKGLEGGREVSVAARVVSG